jgi:hypothetical protein
MAGCLDASDQLILRSLRTQHAEQQHAREPGDLQSASNQSKSRPIRERAKPSVGRVRSGGVGLLSSLRMPSPQVSLTTSLSGAGSSAPRVLIRSILRCLRVRSVSGGDYEVDPGGRHVPEISLMSSIENSKYMLGGVKRLVRFGDDVLARGRFENFQLLSFALLFALFLEQTVAWIG